jgi:hypothetical protein
MTIGQAYFLVSLGAFSAGFVLFLYLRYARSNQFAKWHFPLWAPFAATIAISVLVILYTMIPKGTWDMGPAVAMIFILPFLAALVLVLVFRPSDDAFYKPAMIGTGLFYIVYIAGFLYFVVSPIGRLRL